MSYLTSDLGPSKGFHPISKTTIHLPGLERESYDECTLHLHFALPPLVFVDTHELAQRSASYEFRHWGSRDLEKPVHALPDEGADLLLTVPLPFVDGDTDAGREDGENGLDVYLEVPMHLRYGVPNSSSSSSGNEGTHGHERIHVDWPQGFLSCPRSISSWKGNTKSKEGNDGALSLPSRVASVLPPDNMLVAIPPHSDFSETASVLYLPVGNTQDLAFVEPVTALTILACCFWLFRVATKTASRLNANPAPRPKAKVS
ncbi:hypothetical protein JR316_0011048 [Psilocybe cubensis]|uniref:Protein PBN1 n=2 Tax=Psilocybe cubensis TaxID=181762 RepID=A0A8H8CFT1_PSICU|nr:hypothetical protein JR316_0011048 [Psilocybe cubensis]KAH9477132.1 hypothetical protein JR316_0011048 [Psilocybe cubensis]